MNNHKPEKLNKENKSCLNGQKVQERNVKDSRKKELYRILKIKLNLKLIKSPKEMRQRRLRSWKKL